MKNHLMHALTVFTMVVICFIFAAVDVFADCKEIYAKVGTGYKIEMDEFTRVNGEKYWYDDRTRYSARFEIAVDCGNLTYGIAHHSQWSTGAPFNNKGEPFKTEFFIDYKFSWGL